MHAHPHDSQHLRVPRHAPGQRPDPEAEGLFGACHTPGGYAEVFVLKSTYEGDGPPNLAEACGIEWDYDAYATDASDDHQPVAGTPSDDMDVAGDGEDESESSADDDKMWLLPKVNIPDEPISRKCTYTHLIT